MYAKNIQRLKSFRLMCLRKLLKTKWQDKKPDTEVKTRSGITHLGTIIRQKRLRWFGHVKRMGDSRFPKTILFSKARDGSRKKGMSVAETP